MTEQIDPLVARLEEAFDKVKLWPENSETGMVDLIHLRNLVPETIVLIRSQAERIAALTAERDAWKDNARHLRDQLQHTEECLGGHSLKLETAEARLADALAALERAQERLAQIDCAQIGMMHRTSPIELLDWCKAIASAGFDEVSATLSRLTAVQKESE